MILQHKLEQAETRIAAMESTVSRKSSLCVCVSSERVGERLRDRKREREGGGGGREGGGEREREFCAYACACVCVCVSSVHV